MNSASIVIAIVGHTNTGKTSLLRTLTRDLDFGDVSSRAGTTRQVEGTLLLSKGEPLLALYDTPGLEDAVALYEFLERHTDKTQDGIERLKSFLDSAAARGELEQEAKVLRQAITSDILLYVIDARERMLGRHRDELTVLTFTAKPIIPVLNFVASPEAREQEWREALARLNLHAVIAYDTVLFDLEGERRLFQAMQALSVAHYQRLQALMEERQAQRSDLHRAGTAAIADLLIDAAAFSVRVDSDNASELSSQSERLRERVRQREQRCIDALLAMFAFRPDDAEAQALAVRDGRWTMDPFAAETLRAFGLSAGSGAARGAAVGFGIDILTGTLSLGAATAMGAVIGALWTTLGRFGRRVVDHARGYVELGVDEMTLQLLATRQLRLLAALLQRGHAALAPVYISEDLAQVVLNKRAKSQLRIARLHPQWSRLNSISEEFSDDDERRKFLHQLQSTLSAAFAENASSPSKS